LFRALAGGFAENLVRHLGRDCLVVIVAGVRGGKSLMASCAAIKSVASPCVGHPFG
jgi:hypothetical protein